MVTGLVTTSAYITYFKFGGGTAEHWLFGVSPEGIGFVFMWLSTAIGIVVSLLMPAPPQEIQNLVQDIRIPGMRHIHGAGDRDMPPAPETIS